MKDEKLYGLPEASRLLGGISVWTLRKHLALGSISKVRLGRRVFLSSEEVERVRKDGLPSLHSQAAAEIVQNSVENSLKKESK